MQAEHLESASVASPSAAPGVGPRLGGDVTLVSHIVPTHRRLRLRQLRGYTPVVRVLAARDFKAKYKQSALGPAWLVAQPVALLGALAFAFNGVSHSGTGGVPYLAFALVGLTVWSYFQAALVMGAASLISNFMLIRKTACPRLAFPISSLLATLPTLALTLVFALAVAAITGTLSPRALLLPLGVLWLLGFTAAVVSIAAAVAVRFRDVINALPIILQVGVFVAPIGYATNDLHGTLRTLVDLNPLTGIIEFWRWMLVSAPAPSFGAMFWSLFSTFSLLIIGWRVFGRLETEMADVI